MDRRKERWRMRRGRKRRRQQGRRQGRRCTGSRLCCRAALKELFGLFQAIGLWLQALTDHRGQCEAGLFGNMFSSGPVCLFSIFWQWIVWGREEGGGQGHVQH